MREFFQGENIILLTLDGPSRTTRDYEGPIVSPIIQAAIDHAMKDEDTIELDAK
jgi:kinesin family protein 3/17